MIYSCVTSQTPNIYNHLGSHMIDTWLRCWPAESQLTIYAENVNIKQQDPRIRVLDWHEHCSEDYHNFRTNITRDKRTSRFAKKGFSFLHFLENETADNLVWLDSDLLFYKQIPESLLESLLPNNKLIALFDCYYQENPEYTTEQYNDCQSRGRMAAESGFVIINKNNSCYDEYVKNYRTLYTSAEPHPALWKRYDGEICLVAACEFLDQVEDLSKHRNTNKTQTPLNRSWLGEYVSHHKGRSKDGYSKDHIQNILESQSV